MDMDISASLSTGWKKREINISEQLTNILSCSRESVEELLKWLSEFNVQFFKTINKNDSQIGIEWSFFGQNENSYTPDVIDKFYLIAQCKFYSGTGEGIDTAALNTELNTFLRSIDTDNYKQISSCCYLALIGQTISRHIENKSLQKPVDIKLTFRPKNRDIPNPSDSSSQDVTKTINFKFNEKECSIDISPIEENLLNRDELLGLRGNEVYEILLETGDGREINKSELISAIQESINDYVQNMPGIMLDLINGLSGIRRPVPSSGQIPTMTVRNDAISPQPSSQTSQSPTFMAVPYIPSSSEESEAEKDSINNILKLDNIPSGVFTSGATIKKFFDNSSPKYNREMSKKLLNVKNNYPSGFSVYEYGEEGGEELEPYSIDEVVEELFDFFNSEEEPISLSISEMEKSIVINAPNLSEEEQENIRLAIATELCIRVNAKKKEKDPKDNKLLKAAIRRDKQLRKRKQSTKGAELADMLHL